MGHNPSSHFVAFTYGFYLQSPTLLCLVLKPFGATAAKDPTDPLTSGVAKKFDPLYYHYLKQFSTSGPVPTSEAQSIM